MKKEKLTLKRTIGYGMGDIFGGGAFTLVGTLYMNFLTDNIFISATIVGIMMLVGKFWDAIIDPFIGNFSESIRSKIGRRRIFFLAGIFHIGAAFLSLWMPFGGMPMWFKIIYFTLAYMLFATSFSLTMVPYHAMLPELTDDLKLRNRTVAIRTVISNCSAMIAGLVPMMIVNAVKNSNPQLAYVIMGVVFAIFYTIPWIIVFFATKGLDDTKVEDTKMEKVSIFKAFIENAKVVLKNKSFTKLLGLYLLGYTAMDIFMAIIVYYVKWYLGVYGVDKVLGIGINSFILGIFMIFELISIPFYNAIANKKGKRSAFITSAIWWASAALIMIFLGSKSNYENNRILVFVGIGLMGLGAGGVALLPWQMLPETMDVEELINGERKDAVYSGFLTFIRQLSQGVALFILGLCLGLLDDGATSVVGDIIKDLGYLTNNGDIKTFTDLTPAEYQEVFKNIPEQFKTIIRLLTSLLPALLLIGSAIAAITYPINNKNFHLIHEEINNRNTSSKEDIHELERIAGKKNLQKILDLQKEHK